MTIEIAETQANQVDDDLRQQQDIALVALILRSAVLSERQLSKALRSWTIHGSVSLKEHLCQSGLIDETQLEQLSVQVSEWLAEKASQRTGRNGNATQSLILSTLENVDPSGKISKLMGIQSVAGSGMVDSADRRQAHSGFSIVRKIGQGGLGRVWLARDEHLNRFVAIKEVTGQGGPAALERFRREAKITGQLEHPGIVPIYQLGTDEQSGQAFYAMRFLGKSTLHDSIMEYHERRAEGDDDPMLIRRLLSYFVSVCQAIGHAHSRKVIHRDLKPENIAIDSFGQVIVIDWGIAKVIDDVGGNDGSSEFDSAGGGETLQGQVLGTPLFMAPEQAAGRIDELDERTDIYGLGAILFAILTGTPPHETTRNEAQASGGRELLTAISSRPTPNAREADGHVDTALAAVCEKAMARKQYARYQTASELADDVQRWMAGEPVSAHRESRAQQFGRWIQHHRLLSQFLGLILIVTAVLVATVAATSRQNQIAARNARFEQLHAYDKEIEVQLESDAISLMQDARFMSTLPPIQAIIDIRNGDSDAVEDEAVWRERLQTIYEGALLANPNYLSISYSAKADEDAMSIVRVERSASNARQVRRVPHSRLAAAPDAGLFEATGALSPGDVVLSVRQEESLRRFAPREVRLVAVTPVFNERTGEHFGAVTLETDLLSRLVHFLDRLAQSNANVYVTDVDGGILVSDENTKNAQIESVGVSVWTELPAVKSFFSESSDKRLINEQERWISNRIPLDASNPKATLGVILHVHDEN